MASLSDMMKQFDFLIGSWDMEYRVPRSAMSEEGTGRGSGRFKRALQGHYVYFDYTASLTTGDGAAHAVFVWDGRIGNYRFWWFEDSGQFMTATCNFTDEKTLYLHWHDTLLRQTFKQIEPDRVILRMEKPDSGEQYELVLEVEFTRK